MVLVSAGATIPTFIIGILFIVFSIGKPNQPLQQNSPLYVVWPLFFASLLPAWLLVQAGHGKLNNTPENTPLVKLIPNLGISLIIRLLRLAGVIIVISISAEQVMIQPGLGRLLVGSSFQRDFR